MIGVRRIAAIIKGRGIATKTNSSRDLFGDLSERGSQALAIKCVENFVPDDPDGYDKEVIDLTPRKNAYYYKYEISKYARRGSIGLRKALQLFHQMKTNDRLEPGLSSFSPLIYGCSKAGYTKKAFELYEESLRYHSKPTQSTVTCLINACGECPFTEYGIERLDWFRTHLKLKYNYKMNKIQYHSAIKAYGKLGKLDQASKLVQEMIDEGITPESQTLDMLLIGCCSNKESGASLALRVYKRMKNYNLKPTLKTYRLLLRCIRDCDIGSMEDMKQTLAELPALVPIQQRHAYKAKMKRHSNDLKANFEWLPFISDIGKSLTDLVKIVPSHDSSIKLIEGGDVPKKLLENEAPSFGHRHRIEQSINLLSDDHLGLVNQVEAIQIDKLKSAKERLLLFGGMNGYLEQMVRDGCKPDNKTFCLLLGCIGCAKDRLMDFFRLSKFYSIQRDLLFYDLIIRRACMNFMDPNRLDTAFFFIEEMHKDGLKPNISTFESLSLGCQTYSLAKRLLSDIEKIGMTTSDIMIWRLYDCALVKKDFYYLNQLITYCRKHLKSPNKILIEKLEKLRIDTHAIVVKQEKEPSDNKLMSEHQIKSYDIFCDNLEYWLKLVPQADKDHPWEQFYFEKASKKSGFIKYGEKFKALEELKQEKLKSNRNFGNLFAESEKASRERGVRSEV